MHMYVQWWASYFVKVTELQLHGKKRMECKNFFHFTAYELRCHKMYNAMKKDFVLDRRDGRVANASVSTANLARETGFDSHVNQIQHKLPMARHCFDVKLCASGALKRGWAPQTCGTRERY